MHGPVQPRDAEGHLRQPARPSPGRAATSAARAARQFVGAGTTKLALSCGSTSARRRRRPEPRGRRRPQADPEGRRTSSPRSSRRGKRKNSSCRRRCASLGLVPVRRPDGLARGDARVLLAGGQAAARQPRADAVAAGDPSSRSATPTGAAGRQSAGRRRPGPRRWRRRRRRRRSKGWPTAPGGRRLAGDRGGQRDREPAPADAGPADRPRPAGAVDRPGSARGSAASRRAVRCVRIGVRSVAEHAVAPTRSSPQRPPTARPCQGRAGRRASSSKLGSASTRAALARARGPPTAGRLMADDARHACGPLARRSRIDGQRVGRR